MRVFVVGVLTIILGLPGSAPVHDPAAGAVELFASGVAGPEGLAFTRDRGLLVGTTVGDILRFTRDGSSTVLANVGDFLASITYSAPVWVTVRRSCGSPITTAALG